MSAQDEAPLLFSDAGVNTPTWESARFSARLERGQLLLLTGPVGSGKSLLAEALSGVTRPGVTFVGSVMWGSESASARLASIAFAPEDARLAVLPTDTVGATLSHAARQGGASSGTARAAATRHLLSVGLSDASRIWHLQFRELSTAERRRATLALALARRPGLLVLDGPFSSLDERGRSAVLRALGEYLAMGGRVVAFDRTPDPLASVAHVHCALGGTRRPSSRPPPSEGAPPRKDVAVSPLLELTRVGTVRGRQGWLRRARRTLALDGATLGVGRGEVVALVGDNGSGKTSMLELAAGLLPVAFGELVFDGNELRRSTDRRSRRARRQMQLVHQEAATALGQHKTVRELLEESVLRTPSKSERTEDRVVGYLARVGLSPSLLDCPADQLSLGEAQRVALARALAARPALLLLDTPGVAGWGDQGEAAGLRTILDPVRASGAAVLLAEPNLARVRTIADRVAVLLSGRVVECGAPEVVIARPLHPYTAVFVKRTFDAEAKSRPSNPAPSSGPRSSVAPPSGDSLLDRHRRRLRLALEGAAPDPRSPSRGCPYVAHCPKAIDLCSAEEPPLAEALPGSGHQVACWRPN